MSAEQEGSTRSLCLIIPVYNEESGLAEFHSRLESVLMNVDAELEVLYVDDGSDDATANVVREIMGHDARIGLIQLSRNFGKDIALSAGLDHAETDAVICIDADLQHPPEVIPSLVDGWLNGHDIVFGVRRSRRDQSLVRRVLSRLFYRILGVSGEVRVPPDAGDFRLMSRPAYEAVRQCRENHRFMKGLYAWVGFPQTSVVFDVEPRVEGRSRWRPLQLLRYALDGITSFSIVPIRLVTLFGVATACISFLYGSWIVLKTLWFGDPVPGFPSIMATILFLGGLQLVAIGILGEYVGRTFIESKQRPLYWVRRYCPPKKSRGPGCT